MATTDAATFCATLVDEWARAGIRAAFVAPGSRSTPLALALATDERLAVHVFHDERAAAFAALGHALVTSRPSVLVCTSGTAAAHFHAAVVEADLSSVPLLVCTADRPPELWDIGAPQTIDQHDLYGSAVRFRAEPGVPDASASSSWRSLASRTVAEALGWSGRPGPVHLNLSFRDPLVGEPARLPPGRVGGAPWHDVDLAASHHGSVGRGTPAPLPPFTRHDPPRAVDGVIVAGAGTPDPEVVAALAQRLGWPILADHRSGCRGAANAIIHFDGLLRSRSFAVSARPEIVLRFGEGLASKVLGQWLSATAADERPATVVSVVERTRWSDPERTSAAIVGAGAAAALLNELPATLEASTLGARWLDADRRAAEAVEVVLGEEANGDDPSEVDIARAVIANLPAGGALVVSSSMPVRDIEWFGPARDDVEVYANRGANGIDGVIATAIGVALDGRPTTVLLGDVAFLHDSSALIGLRHRPVELHVVVIDNDGGGIFSFLPQAELLDPAVYEALFGTPHGTDLAGVAAAHGLTVEPWPGRRDRTGTGTGTETDRGGAGHSSDSVTVTVARTDRQANAALHGRLNQAIADAVER